jgi:hypothetical protein
MAIISRMERCAVSSGFRIRVATLFLWVTVFCVGLGLERWIRQEPHIGDMIVSAGGSVVYYRDTGIMGSPVLQRRWWERVFCIRRIWFAEVNLEDRGNVGLLSELQKLRWLRGLRVRGQYCDDVQVLRLGDINGHVKIDLVDTRVTEHGLWKLRRILRGREIEVYIDSEY